MLLVAMAVLVLANLAAMNPISAGDRHNGCASATAAERPSRPDDITDARLPCCLNMQCCPLLPQLAFAIAPTTGDEAPEEYVAVQNTLLLIWVIDPPPKLLS
jgi:hypothetical protein